ncbi:TipC family immunity protein [Streptococcus orisratti]|uniref:TipC family immunity protein n=1 Tax=Streptococcus orisratti TaxID=114652 RepID=UPI0003696996|nr:TipC family immunity protein [Streptococcus orisratti]
MKKKMISLAILCVLALSAGVYYYIHQPKNIFDEIYQETQNSDKVKLKIVANLSERDIDRLKIFI